MKLSERTQFEDLPAFWQEKILKLRRENRKMRLERNDYRQQFINSQFELEQLRFENRAGEDLPN